ncbi:MAG: DUF5943 domain-containing protein [Alphaproteobacteria bacterium]|jgi:hypothetical protein|nr:DUF5943 domain-containing protein [Alphaproteobacteria bacterium]MDP6567460.1 DUF5943 domain-containing protein [Alphaproteobacteria bacterium]MDP6816034.1 DUF5943 domain-containing protein [Alphaproteobacteria bacterium]
MSTGNPPRVPIEVDPETGVWTTDGLPMLYMPRHFFINNHLAMEQALGRPALAELLYESGHRSAYYWCQQEAATHGLGGIAVFHHYLRRMSQRGWGQFDGGGIDPDLTGGEVLARHSCFVEQQDGAGGGRLCYMFAGVFPGALDWVAEDLGRGDRFRAEESHCAAEGGDACVFTVTRLAV